MRLQTACITVVLGFIAIAAFADDGVDSIQWQDQSRWSCAATIAVAPLPVTGEFKGARSQSDYMRQFVAELSRLMVGRSGIQSVSLSPIGTEPIGDAVIEGQFRDLTTGSRAARFWIGFGAGKSRCEVNLSGFSLPDRRPLFYLNHARISAAGLKADEIEENVSEVAEDIARALLAARTNCAHVAVAPTAQNSQSASTVSTVPPLALNRTPSGTHPEESPNPTDHSQNESTPSATSSKGGVDVRIESKVVDSTNATVTIAWTLTLSNLRREPVNGPLIVQFLDSDGFLLLEVEQGEVSLAPRESSTLRGNKELEARLGAKVARLAVQLRAVVR